MSDARNATSGATSSARPDRPSVTRSSSAARCLASSAGRHVGLDEPRRHGIDENAVRRRFPCERPREPDEARLARRVAGLAPRADVRARGDDVDDASPATDHHAADDRLAAKKRPRQVHAQDLVPVGLFEEQERAVAGDAGIVDQDVDRAELLRRPSRRTPRPRSALDTSHVADQVPDTHRRRAAPSTAAALVVACAMSRSRRPRPAGRARARWLGRCRASRRSRPPSGPPASRCRSCR